MGFFDSMRKSFDEEVQSSMDRQAHSSYRTVVQKETDRYNKFAGQSDSALLGKYNSSFTSDEDKKVIASILQSRGYERRRNGSYGRR